MHGIREMEDVFADEIAAMTDRRNLLRDHFAGLAMAAHIGLEIYAKGELMPHEVAEHAYEMADAMLATREQGT